MAKAKGDLAMVGLSWMLWLLGLAGWSVLLSGISSLQQDCGSSRANSLAAIGGAGYLGPVSCQAIYRLTWWITWYLFGMLVLLAVLFARGAVHTFRGGIIGLLGPLVMLLMDTANTFLYANGAPGVDSGSLHARARTTVAGAIISAVATLGLLLALGNEREIPWEERVGAPKAGQETRGGVYQSRDIIPGMPTI